MPVSSHPTHKLWEEMNPEEKAARILELRDKALAKAFEDFTKETTHIWEAYLRDLEKWGPKDG